MPNATDGRLRIGILLGRLNPAERGKYAVTYQYAQFHALEQHADVIWGPQVFDLIETTDGDPPLDAVIVFDETNLMTDERVARIPVDLRCLFVYVTHDFTAHPVRVAEFLRDRRALMVLRHHTSMRLFGRLLPDMPKVMQRPGVDTEIFKPVDTKEYDVLISGSETPDYPVRQRLNALVREAAPRMGWKLLDLTAVGLVSDPLSGQFEYAPSLAAAKVSPTGTNSGGLPDATLVTQYLTSSPVRADLDHEFYGNARPDVMVERFPTAAITPRYLESLAAGTLLIGDLPDADPQEFYRDKMVVIDPDDSDDHIVGLIDEWIRDDERREELCRRGLEAVRAGESSEHRGRELAEIIARHV